jgi:hypothetical protein
MTTTWVVYIEPFDTGIPSLERRQRPAHEPEQVPRAERGVDRAFIFEDRHTADPRPEPAQNERLMILPFDADSA